MEAKQEYRSSVYVWGSTAHGALGCPDTKVKAAATKKVQLVPKKLTECCTMRIMNGGNPLRVVDGNGYSTVITDKFEGYTWGDGRGGGGSSERRNASVALRANAGPCKMKKVHASSITSIAHGIGHNYALSLKGELYCWGDVNYLVHGTGKPANSIDHHGRPRPKIRAGGNESRQTFTHPTKIDIGVHSSKVTAVACGEKHACILLQNGTIMTSGANDAGQLGLGVIHELKEKGRGFHIIQSVRRGNSCLNCVTFKELACGNNHCAAISSDGASLYTWGWGDAGRLGMGNEKMHNQPTCVESLSIFAPFAVVSCGSAQTLVATEGGDVYGFGWNAHGQVSGAIKYDHTGGSSDSCQLPVLCLKNKGVVKLSCSGFHSAAITLAGDLYMWGKSRPIETSNSGTQSTAQLNSSL
jgi:alpha-tubulin suppressor-like RCC1 family protein